MSAETEGVDDYEDTSKYDELPPDVLDPKMHRIEKHKHRLQVADDEHTAMKHKGMKICSGCGKPIPTDAKTCPFCHATNKSWARRRLGL